MDARLVMNDSDIFIPLLQQFENLPPAFINNRTPLSEYLSISSLGSKKISDTYLLPQLKDDCVQIPLDDCLQQERCAVYKTRCVHKSRITPFRELSKEMGNKIQGKLTVEPFVFIIHKSHEN